MTAQNAARYFAVKRMDMKRLERSALYEIATPEVRQQMLSNWSKRYYEAADGLIAEQAEQDRRAA